MLQRDSNKKLEAIMSEAKYSMAAHIPDKMSDIANPHIQYCLESLGFSDIIFDSEVSIQWQHIMLTRPNIGIAS